MEDVTSHATANNNAIKFYKEWVDNGSWTLQEAAWLYAGYHPVSKKFYGTFERPGSGRYIEPPDRFAREGTDSDLVDESEAPIDPCSDNFDQQTSLTIFVQNHLDAGNLSALSHQNGILKFKPRDITVFFQNYFVNVPPQALLIALGLVKQPVSKSFSAPKNAMAHETAYRAYHNEQIDLYMQGKIRKPWAAHDKEEPIISSRMGEGFNRKRFREARRKILAPYPNFGKTMLSSFDHEKLKTFISEKSEDSEILA